MRMLIAVPLLGFMSFSLAAFMPQSVDTSRQGMIYGHLDGPAAVERVELMPIGGLRHPSARVLPNGDFYFADLAPGQYVLTRFRAGGTWHELVSDRGVKTLTMDVDAGVINFAGSWQVTPRGVAPIDKPMPDVLLKRLRYSLRGTGWERKIP